VERIANDKGEEENELLWVCPQKKEREGTGNGGRKERKRQKRQKRKKGKGEREEFDFGLSRFSVNEII
jgi:hypothetical protein